MEEQSSHKITMLGNSFVAIEEEKRRQALITKEDRTRSFRPGKKGYTELLEAMKMARQYIDNKEVSCEKNMGR